MTRFLIGLALLTSLYLIIVGRLQPWDLIAGLLLSTVFLILWRADSPPHPFAASSLLAFPLFAGAVARTVITGCWQVLVVASRLRPLATPGMIEVPIGERSRLGVAVFALVVTLSPGSVVIDVDWHGEVILLHLLDASNPEAERRRLEAFYCRYQRPVFP